MKIAHENEVKADELNANELEQVAGGLIGNDITAWPGTVEKMPSRDEMCGTIWILSRSPFPRRLF